MKVEVGILKTPCKQWGDSEAFYSERCCHDQTFIFKSLFWLQHGKWTREKARVNVERLIMRLLPRLGTRGSPLELGWWWWGREEKLLKEVFQWLSQQNLVMICIWVLRGDRWSLPGGTGLSGFSLSLSLALFLGVKKGSDHKFTLGMLNACRGKSQEHRREVWLLEAPEQ